MPEIDSPQRDRRTSMGESTISLQSPELKRSDNKNAIDASRGVVRSVTENHDLEKKGTLTHSSTQLLEKKRKGEVFMKPVSMVRIGIRKSE